MTESPDRPHAPPRLGSDAVAVMPFVVFMESLATDGLDLTRPRDPGREVELDQA